jgi:ribosomal protein S18 acetylase RimI-like enzyme
VSEPFITIEDDPAVEDVRLLWDRLGEYNFSQTGQKAQLISVFLRNEQHEVIGAAHGWTGYGWLHIRAFWLREDQRQRGWGSLLLRATEAEAVKRGCQYSHLETFSFQALGFYQKNGYRVFGELGNVAGDHRWYFLEKDILLTGQNHRLTFGLRRIFDPLVTLAGLALSA